MNATKKLATGWAMLTLLTLLLTPSCDEAGQPGRTWLNQTASLGGAAAGGRGTVQIVIINNTPYRAVLTVGLYDQTDPGFGPAFEQFGQREIGRVLEADSTSDILSIECARVLSVGGPTLLRLIDENVLITGVDTLDLDDTDALVDGVEFFDVADPSRGLQPARTFVGAAPALEALLGADFPCDGLLIIRLEFDDVGPRPFRIDFELIK